MGARLRVVVELLDKDVRSRLGWRWRGSLVRGWGLERAMGAVRVQGVEVVAGVVLLGTDCHDEAMLRAENWALMSAEDPVCICSENRASSVIYSCLYSG
jgi:hypothetical protein